MQAQATAAPMDDSFYEEAVTRNILDWQPTILRLEDLIQLIAPDPSQFSHRDAVALAVSELTKVGLLHRQGECILPTPALIYVEGWHL
jgi:hypothetical protein